MISRDSLSDLLTTTYYYPAASRMSSWPGPNGWHGPPRYMTPVGGYKPYSPPAWFNPPDPYHSAQLLTSHPTSAKYPKLNPILAEDTTLLHFDLKKQPTSAILPPTYFTYRTQFAIATSTTHMRLVSKAFPWQIDIVSPGNVTCEDVWHSLWNALQQPIEDSEWGFLIREKKSKETVDAAVKRRLELDPMSDRRPKRIDYLGNMTLFRGLEKDDEYAKLRQLPYSKNCEETWVVRLFA